jgi:hypothetical protein
MPNIEELQRRIAELEEEVRDLRWLLIPRADETPAERGARNRCRAELGREEEAKLAAKVLEEMGIRGEPIGAKRVREMMIAEGVDPEKNEFSKGIIEMREE